MERKCLDITIDVFYSPSQDAPAGMSLEGPSAHKPRLAVESWLRLGLPIDVRAFEPATVSDLTLAHDRAYVEGVMSGTIRSGFDTTDLAFAETLPWTVGSMVAAARQAIASGRGAVSPTSGFHHAHHGYGGAFCTFNGLMVAGLKLLQDGSASHIGILDGDKHDGDGTRDIIQTLGVSNQFTHYSFGGDAAAKADPEAWLERLPEIVRTMASCQIILYQAGADPHQDDPLGGLMTTEQLGRRDRLVFSVARQIGVPVAWNLAGGYQEPFSRVLALHDQTMLAYAEEVADPRSRCPKRTPDN